MPAKWKQRNSAHTDPRVIVEAVESAGRGRGEARTLRVYRERLYTPMSALDYLADRFEVRFEMEGDVRESVLHQMRGVRIGSATGLMVQSQYETPGQGETAAHKEVVAAMPDVPFLCHFERAVEVCLNGPYQELVNLWKMRPRAVQDHYRTLSYFDCMNLASRITCPILMSVALLDTMCPPSTGFAVYNHLTSTEKEMRVYPYNEHEGGGAIHEEEKYRFVRKYFR